MYNIVRGLKEKQCRRFNFMGTEEIQVQGAEWPIITDGADAEIGMSVLGGIEMRLKKPEKSVRKGEDGLSWILLLLGAFFLFVFSFTTSPLTRNSWGSDSVFFQYVGYSTAMGQVMYRDIFDTKGPYLFLIQQIAYFVGGHYGRYVLFLFQYICMTASLFLLDKTCCLFHSKNSRWRLISALLFFFMLSYTLDGGNLTEEYSLPLLSLCQYLALKTIKARDDSEESVYPLKYTFCYGVCFGIIAFLRITNACLICCIILYFLIRLSMERQWGQLIKNIVVFIVGLITAVVPMLLWYAYLGSLKEMFYAAFVFGFSYATKEAGRLRLGMYAPMLLMCLIAVFLYIAGKRKQDEGARHTDAGMVQYLVICLAVYTIVLLLGKAYVHYYQLIIPPTLCAFWLIAGQWKKKWTFLLLSVIVVLNVKPLVVHTGRIVAAVGLNTEKSYNSPLGRFAEKLLVFDTSGVSYGYRMKQNAGEIFEQIPDDEKDSVYSNSPTWLFLTERLSDCRYLETPGAFMLISEQIQREMEDWLSAGKWKYAVLEKKGDMCIEDAVTEHYQIVWENNDFKLFRLKQSAGSGRSGGKIWE